MSKLQKMKKQPRRNKYLFGVAHINSTFNNTIITISDLKGNTLTWASAGSAGFHGAKRSTAYAAQIAAETASVNAANLGLKSIKIYVKGFGDGRESAIRGLLAGGLQIKHIKDITSIPHNGCRPPKRRRL